MSKSADEVEKILRDYASHFAVPSITAKGGMIKAIKDIDRLVVQARIEILTKLKGYDFTDDIETEEVEVYRHRIEGYIQYMIDQLKQEMGD